MEKQLIIELNELSANLKAEGYKNWSYACLSVDKAIEYISKQAGFISKYNELSEQKPTEGDVAKGAEEFFNKRAKGEFSIIQIMQEYALQESKQAREKAIQECIPLIEKCEKTLGVINRIFTALKENSDPSALVKLIEAIDINLPLTQAKIKDELEKLKHQ